MNVIRPLLQATWDDASFLGARHGRAAPAVARLASFAVEVLQRPRVRLQRADGATRLAYFGNDDTFFRGLADAFASAPRTTSITRLRGLAPLQDALSDAPDADVVAVELPRWAAANAAARGWLVLPRWIALTINLRTPESILWDAKKRGRVARLARTGLDYEVVSGDEAVAAFYDDMYVPTARARHGDEAFIRRRRFVHHAAAIGSILFVRRAGERVAGMLLVDRRADGARAPTIDAWIAGVRDGDYADADSEVRDALYGFAIRWARDVRGAERLGLTSAPPFLGDGLLRYKKRWGARVEIAELTPLVVALRIVDATPAVIAGMQRACPIHLRGGAHPRLVATTIATNENDAAALADRFVTPGIDDVTVLVDRTDALAARLVARARACVS